MWQAVVTDLGGVQREFVENYDALTITPTLNGYRELTLSVDPYDASVSDLLIGERAIKVYDAGGVLRFNGKIWEPLERGAQGVKVVARGPFAEFSWRRVRAQTDYTATNNAGGPWDAGQIFADRIAIQNGYRSTYLRMGTRQASANRLRSYGPGTDESKVIEELTTAAGGFYFLEDPLDGVAGFMAEIRVLYPNAGTTREEVRFEFGIGTLDNCSDFSFVQRLPRTRQVTSSSAASGGRISQAAEDTAAIAQWGLFEDESSFSDVTDTALLLAQSQAALTPTVLPTTIAFTPTLDAPVLFRDFNVGDFVRGNIVLGAFSFFGWARISAATLQVDADGLESMSSLTLELLTGGAPTSLPEDLLSGQLDESRRRLEALERKVQDIVATSPDPGAAGSAGGKSADPAYVPPADPIPATIVVPGVGGAPPTYVDNPNAAAPDPPASYTPPSPPTVSIAAAYGSSTQTVHVEADVTTDGESTTVTAWAEVGGVLKSLSGSQTITANGRVIFDLGGLSRNTSYTIHVSANSTAGYAETTATAVTFRTDLQ